MNPMTNPRVSQNTIHATYRMVTPMFCGGAEQQAEFRLASFKGVLRPTSETTGHCSKGFEG